MSQTLAVFEELDDWEVLCSFLPEGWEGKARESGALTRARGVEDAPALLRTLLIHIATGCSLAETSVRARQMGLARLNAAAVYKRLRSAEEWLRWLAEQLRGDLGMVAPRVGRRVRAVDATAVSEPGSTGTDWRIHYAINLQTLQCDFFELTDGHGGEAWRRFPVLAGDIMLGDRGYANPPGVQHVVEAGGDVAVRLNRGSLPLSDARGRRLAVLELARPLSPQQTGEWAAWVRPESGPAIPGRLVAVRKSRQAAAYARQRQKQARSRVQLRRRIVWSLAEAREALTRLLGVAVDWIDMDNWLIAYCVDPRMRRTARASSFSASLEFVREGKLELRQDKAFSPIWVRAARPRDPTQAA